MGRQQFIDLIGKEIVEDKNQIIDQVVTTYVNSLRELGTDGEGCSTKRTNGFGLYSVHKHMKKIPLMICTVDALE